MHRDPKHPVTGTGIGLAVARELVGLHGGEAWVENAESGGARFVVELPGVTTTADSALSRAEGDTA